MTTKRILRASCTHLLHPLSRIHIYGLLICVWGLASCTPRAYLYTSFHEPATAGLRYLVSDDGLHWDSLPGTHLTPQVGRQHIMRDPSVIRTPDGIFHLVWTSSWRGDRGFGTATSHDLLRWTDQRYVEVMADTSTVNVWAPELFYDDTRGETMVIWASCVPGTFPDGAEDRLNNQRLYYTTTTDFRHFAPARLLIEPGFSCIDATIVRLGRRRYVMVLKDNTRPERNLKISFARDPRGPWSPPSAPVTEHLSEGPAVAQVGAHYYIYYDRYGQKDFGAIQTRDFIHFERADHQVSLPRLHKHGTIIQIPRRYIRQLRKQL